MLTSEESFQNGEWMISQILFIYIFSHASHAQVYASYMNATLRQENMLTASGHKVCWKFGSLTATDQ